MSNILENWKNSQIDAIFDMFKPNVNRTGSAGWNLIIYCKNKLIDFGCVKYTSFLNKLQNKLKNIPVTIYILILGVFVMMVSMLVCMLYSTCLMYCGICTYMVRICWGHCDKIIMIIIMIVTVNYLTCNAKTNNIINLNIQVNFLLQSAKDTTDTISDEDINKMASDYDDCFTKDSEDFELIL